MEGTVTISLKDYEELKVMEKVKESMTRKSVKAIELLEKNRRIHESIRNRNRVNK